MLGLGIFSVVVEEVVPPKVEVVLGLGIFSVVVDVVLPNVEVVLGVFSVVVEEVVLPLKLC